MAKTFTDINGDPHVLNISTRKYDVDYDQDILSNEISRYYVIEDYATQIIVSKDVYDAIQKYLSEQLAKSFFNNVTTD